MANKRELTDLIDSLFTLKTITQTYQQIAANHIRVARTSVVNNRDFITELLGLFQEVKASYRDELERLLRKNKSKDKQKLSLIRRNGKTNVVFLAANTGLYGSIVGKTASLFVDYLKKNECDITIIGRLGESLFLEHKTGKKYTYFDFPDAKVDPEILKNIITHLLHYEKVYVFYGQFQSIVSQDPIIAAIDGGMNIDNTTMQQAPAVKYLFEPSIDKIIVFFETEIFGLVFEQAIRESQLAKHASRMFALDKAIQNINVNLNRTTQQKSFLHHRMLNSKQQNALAGMSLWAGRR